MQLDAAENLLRVEQETIAPKRRKIVHNMTEQDRPENTRSCKNLSVDLDGLREKHLGKIIPPLGGQVKRAAMEAASADGSPTFSRMSGIQEWNNAVFGALPPT